VKESNKFSALSTLDLFQLSAAIAGELHARQIVRTSNLAGCYAERLFSEAFGWTLERNSKAGYDALYDGVRYQIKSRRPTSRNRSRQLGEFSKFEQRRFDKLAALIFAEDYTIHRAALLDYDEVVRLSNVVQGRRRFMLDDRVWHEAAVEDVTEPLKAAQSRL
jgi:hypothetical protein